MTCLAEAPRVLRDADEHDEHVVAEYVAYLHNGGRLTFDAWLNWGIQ
jgi:hypothetical protein